MGFCADEATTYLRGLGYNVVRHPRQDLRPLLLLGRQAGEVLVLGSVEGLTQGPGRGLPAVDVGQTAADINGRSTGKFSSALGLNILDSLLGALGAAGGVRAHYRGARSIQFTFTDVEVDRVDPLDVGDYLRDSEVDADNPILHEYILGNGELYVVTQTVKSNQLSVTAETNDGSGVRLDVPAIQDALGGRVAVSRQGQSSTAITYSGTKKLVFGFKCFTVGLLDGRISLVATRAGSLALALSSLSPASGPPALLSRHGLVEIQD